jgi:hypothetical protein
MNSDKNKKLLIAGNYYIVSPKEIYKLMIKPIRLKDRVLKLLKSHS